MSGEVAMVKKRKGYKYPIYPTKTQASFIRKNIGCCRYVYNRMLALCKESKEASDDKSTWIRPSTKYTSIWKHELIDEETGEFWLQEADSSSLNYEIRHLDTAYKNFFAGRANFPKFKKKRHGGSYTTQNNVKRTNIRIEMSETSNKLGKIRLPKMGFVSGRFHRLPEGSIVSATISETPSGKFYVSLNCEYNTLELPKITETKHPIGIDLGLIDFATLSDGTRIENPKYLKSHLSELAREQKKLSRKKKGSNNYQKQRVKVARVHERVSNARKYHHHVVSSHISSQYDFVAMEDLNIKGMMKNKYLARAIGDAGWYEFLSQLSYKLDDSGKSLVQIGRFTASSKLCDCGYVNHDLTLADREWVCPECGQLHDRDLHAANMILREGLRIFSEQSAETP